MNAIVISELDVLKKENELLKLQLAKLQEQIEWLRKQVFGKKSERFVSDEQYLPGLEPQEIEEPVEEKIQVPAHEKRKIKSTPINTISFPDNLPVEKHTIDLPEEEKKDPVSGALLICIGEEVSRKLAKKPAYYFVKEITRKKYVTAGRAEEEIKTPHLPDSIITRCAVDESIIADVLTKKFCDHLPLYRQVEMMSREQIRISKQTLSSYVMQVGKHLKPLYDLLEKEIKACGNIFVDETPVDMLAPGTGKTTQGYMVVMAGGKSLNPALRIYKFFTNRKHEGFEKLFEGYRGVFHSDKYGAYEKAAKDKEKIWCPCVAHIRRKYVEAGGDPQFREEILLYIQKLFEVEEKAKHFSPGERVEVRKKEAEPIIDLLIEKNKQRLQRTLLPKSNLSGAIGYFLGLIPHLKNYITNPYARLDNNVAERALKLVVIGRKNWLFVGSEGGGEATAVIYSLAQTCRALNINPYEYFENILRRLQSHPYNKLSELLPHNWKKH